MNSKREEMKEPKIAQKGPYVIDLKSGRYCWCSCGLSENQPFCDGSHKKEGLFMPVWIDVEKPKKIAFCGCKHTKTPPYCDGTHKNL